jgi:carboxypeptidase C (cathepsin A)
MKFLLFFLFATCLFAAEDSFSWELKRTSHVYNADGASLPYTAITGSLPISDREGKYLAELFFIAYLVEDASERPITFVFPGGPGGSTEAEVMCSIGPRRLVTPEEGKRLLPPYKIIDNPESLLPLTDLVFVDPVTTGYSKFVEEAEDADKDHLFSTEGDIASLGDFVQTFVSYFRRWNSPKYLAGISYGTLRCCGIAEYLTLNSFGLHGIVLMSSALDYSLLIGQRNHPLPDALLIPTFAATAWYHGRFWPDASLEQVVDYARRFVYDRYTPFMLQPNRLGAMEKNGFYSSLSELIGLKEETVRRYLGRFDEALYTTEFMAEERKVIGGMDTRYIGDLSSIQRHYIDEDPSYKDYIGIFCAFNSYLQDELETDRPFDLYTSFSTISHRNWNFASYDSVCLPDVFQRLRRTLLWNPAMKIFSGSGYYDCRTPFAATEFCFDHLDLPNSYLNNFDFKYYEAGHSFVFHLPSLQKLKKDLVKFYER